ncbi:hypothetical protein SAMN05216371_2172 [Streptomyces sp. TLI_053]|nr:hypothetical protein SAMN05216371_2172 [Streptomyces sp. TLI_053]
MVIYTLIGAILALTGIATVFETDPLSAVFYGVCVASPGLWVLVKAPFSRVVSTREGVVYYGMGRPFRASWGEVESIELDVINGAVFHSFCPGVKLTSGRKVAFQNLAGFGRSNRRVSRAVAHMEGALAEYRRSASA